jgi:hypothetical protein
MDKNGKPIKGLSAIENLMDETSWFKETPHYWASAWLSFAYALACVEVVSKSSERARALYNLLEAEIYHHWTNMGMTT